MDKNVWFSLLSGSSLTQILLCDTGPRIQTWFSPERRLCLFALEQMFAHQLSLRSSTILKTFLDYWFFPRQGGVQ